MLKEDITNKIKQAENGRKIWIELTNRLNIKNGDYVILFPHGYDMWAYYGAVYMDDFLNHKKSDRAIALCRDEKTKGIIHKHCTKAETSVLSENESESIIAFYSLYMFTDNLIVFSPDKPNGRNGRGIVGVKGVTVEEIAAIGIYGLGRTSEKEKYSE